jgi:hypothetical protein
VVQVLREEGVDSTRAWRAEQIARLYTLEQAKQFSSLRAILKTLPSKQPRKANAAHNGDGGGDGEYGHIPARENGHGSLTSGQDVVDGRVTEEQKIAAAELWRVCHFDKEQVLHAIDASHAAAVLPTFAEEFKEIQ